MRIVEVAKLDFALEPSRWSFPNTHAAAIAAHWTELRRTKPALYNGRIVLLGRRELSARPDGALRLSGAYFEADYADFIAWRDFGFPGAPVENCFAMAALRSAEGAFLLGEMAPHTAKAGKTYFPAGTPDLNDVFDGRVDLDASARRELWEETGVPAEEPAIRDGWTVVFAGQRVACMKPSEPADPAEEAKARIELAWRSIPGGAHAHHVVRRPGDIDRARTPDLSRLHRGGARLARVLPSPRSRGRKAEGMRGAEDWPQSADRQHLTPASLPRERGEGDLQLALHRVG